MGKGGLSHFSSFVEGKCSIDYQSRIRIDGVRIDHLQHSTTMEGPISWIKSGKVDAVLDIKFPRDPDDSLAFNAILGEIADAISTSISTVVNDPALEHIPGLRELAKPPLVAPEQTSTILDKDTLYKPRVIVDIDLRFRDLKATVPVFNSDLSYVNNALIRPIVAFIKSVISFSFFSFPAQQVKIAQIGPWSLSTPV